MVALENEFRLAELGRNARKKVENDFNIIEIARKYSLLYKEILENNQRHAI